MKTTGLIRIYAKYCAAFLFGTVITATISAQVSHTSFKNFPSADQSKDFAAKFTAFSAETEAEEIRYDARSVTDHTIISIKTGKAEIIDNPDARLKPTSYSYPENSKFDIGLDVFSHEQLMFYARALKQYARKNGYDTEYAFLSNMGMLSNKKRFFVINLSTMKIEESGLVSHGRGHEKSIYAKKYSNIEGSRSTSLGRYKILNKYSGSYGEAYRMTGLDASNWNAFQRNIVLHTMGCIPDIENRMPACVSDGCPAVSLKFLSYLQQIIDTRKKPMLLWIFDSNVEELVLEGNGIYTKYVSKTEISTAVPDKTTSNPQLFDDFFNMPVIERNKFFVAGMSSNKKKNLFERVKLFFKL